MITRQSLTEELRIIEGSWERHVTPEHKLRARVIINQLRNCVCRMCDKHYDEAKSRGNWKGFCSAKCEHVKAKELGYHKGGPRSEYQVLKDAGEVGSVYVCK